MDNKERLLETATSNFTYYKSRSKAELNKLAVNLLGKSNVDHLHNIRLKFFIRDKTPMVAFYALNKFHNERQIKVTLPFQEFIACVHKVKEEVVYDGLLN